MKKLYNIIYCIMGAVVSLLIAAVTPASAGVVLPYEQGFDVGDFRVFSMAELSVRAGEGSPQSGDTYYVASSPGALLGADAIVIATGTNNAGVNDNPAGMDDAYATPSGGANDNLSFSTTTTADPTDGPAVGDSADTWDAEVSALRNHIGDDGQFVVYFNMNDTGNDGLEGIDLLLWAQFTLSGDNVADRVFTLFDIFPSGLYNDWVYAYGTICGSVNTYYHAGPCVDGDPADAQDINQNLGANAAAFAAFNQELNDLIMDPGSGYDLLRMEARMAEMNNGYEQAFILTDTSVRIQVSEPQTLGLISFGLMLILFRAFAKKGFVLRFRK